MNNEQMSITIAALMEKYDVLDILKALKQWHLERAERAPKTYARELHWNASQIDPTINDAYPSTIRGVYEETEEHSN
jgi:hypothetical protein